MPLYRRTRWMLGGLLGILIAAVALYVIKGPVFRPARANVLWITMDSLRADHLGCAGYGRARTPTIDALAGEGVLFAEAIAQANYTRLSVPSTITGMYPTLIGVRTPMNDLDSSFVTVAEFLAAQGYATSAILPEWPMGMYQGIERLEALESSTTLRTETCLDILRQLDGRPFFLWLYYWDPHAPYQPPEEFARPFQSPNTPIADEERQYAGRPDALGYRMILQMLDINAGRLTPGPGFRDRLMNLYDAEIAFVDSGIKEVVNRMKELGLWDNTLVILNADHGEAFGEHSYFFHGYSIYEEEVRVPLIIKPPRSPADGKIIQGPVRNLDITPTILDYCGIPAPPGIVGQSLRPFIEKDISPDLPTCIESNTPERKVHLAGYRHGGYKLIYSLGELGELYDLRRDPREKENLLSPAKGGGQVEGVDILEKERELRTALLEAYGVDDVNDLMVTQRQKKIDPALIEQLKAQGYIY